MVNHMDIQSPVRNSLLRCAPELSTIAQRLETAKAPVLLVGRGVLWSRTWDAVRDLARAVPRLKVATTPGAKGCYPESLPQSVGVFGFGGSVRAETALCDADLVLVLGTRLMEQSSLDWHPLFARDCVYRFDHLASGLVATWDHQVPVDGDLRETLPALARLVAHPEGGDAAQPEVCVRAEATRSPRSGDVGDDRALEPAAVIEAIGEHRDVPVCADAGNSMCWAIERLRRDLPATFYVSLDWGTMGFALPAAIGIAMATGKPTIALTGDGSMAMGGGELHTAVEQRLPVIVVVLNDNGAGMVRAGTAQWFPTLPELTGLSYVTPLDLAAFGRSVGARGVRVRTQDEFRVALTDSLRHPSPTVIDVIIDPTAVPPAISERVRALKTPDGAIKDGGGIC